MVVMDLMLLRERNEREEERWLDRESRWLDESWSLEREGSRVKKVGGNRVRELYLRSSVTSVADSRSKLVRSL